MSDNPVAKFELEFGDDVVVVELEFKFSDNAEQYMDVGTFVQLAAHELLLGMTGHAEEV